MIHQSKSYIRFLRKSKNQHGIHSPFVYDLVTKCFYDRQQHLAYELIKSHRKALKRDKRKIQIKDLGHGSKIFRSSERQINKIAKHAGIKGKRARLLNRLVRYFNPENVLELGTSVGLGTVAIAAGNSNSNITTIEGCPETAEVALAYFNKFNFDSIELLQKPFSEVLPNLKEALDFIVVDGHHSKKATLEYFEALLPLTHNDTIIVFDDIYLNKQMTEAWNLIKTHKKVTVTIDTFKWGIVFLRKQQAKEHFVVRV